MITALAPGKVNLCLYVGSPRADGLHPLVSVVEPVSLADELTLEPVDGMADEVVCPGVPNDNLAARAIALFREHTGWDGPPVRITIDKRVPVAAGMGGGSGDAAATLRLLEAHTGLGADLHALAPRLGMDVASQIEPRRCLMTGAGESVVPLDERGDAAYAILPSSHQLSTPAVYAEFDRLGLGRDLDGVDRSARVNDLEPAARSLLPEIDARLAALRAAGARAPMVCGSGPTVFGTFPTRAEAERAAVPGAILAVSVTADFAKVRAVPSLDP